jgi:hypothetical protein
VASIAHRHARAARGDSRSRSRSSSTTVFSRLATFPELIHRQPVEQALARDAAIPRNPDRNAAERLAVRTAGFMQLVNQQEEARPARGRVQGGT